MTIWSFERTTLAILASHQVDPSIAIMLLLDISSLADFNHFFPSINSLLLDLKFNLFRFPVVCLC